MSYFIDSSQIKRKEALPGLNVRTFWGDRIMVSLVESVPHASPPPHSHPDHEQAGIVLQGEFEMTIGDERKRLRPGDAYVIPLGVQHQFHGLDASTLVVDVFSPPREEYK